MRRIFRNYLISFVIIALFALAITLIDRWAEEKESRTDSREKAPPATETAAPFVPNTARAAK